MYTMFPNSWELILLPSKTALQKRFFLIRYRKMIMFHTCDLLPEFGFPIINCFPRFHDLFQARNKLSLLLTDIG